MRIFVLDPPLFTLPYDQHLSRALSQAGADVTLIGRRLRAYESLHDEPFEFRPMFYRFGDGGADWRTAGWRKLVKGAEHVGGMMRLEMLVRSQRPDVVHLQWLVLPLIDVRFLARLARLTRLVFTMHNSEPLHDARHASRLQTRGDASALSLFSGIIAHTQKTADHLVAQGVPAERIHILAHPPLSLAPRGKTSGDRREGPLRLLFFGSIKGYKGVDVLIRAALEMVRRGVAFRLTIAGRPFESLDVLQAEIRAAGAEDFFDFDLRFVPDADLARYLDETDIVVFPYREIDASGAFALAIEAGKPIVASAVGVFKEEPNASHLALVPPDDPIVLAEALSDLLRNEDHRRQLQEKVVALRAHNTSWASFASQSLAIYEGLQTPARIEG